MRWDEQSRAFIDCDGRVLGGDGKPLYSPKEPSEPTSRLPDSGARIDYGTGAQREPATGKGRFDLLPPHALRRVAVHFENGSAKYAPRNWERGLPCSRYVDSALRHMFAWLEGGKQEDHLAAGVWNLLCLIETEHRARSGMLPATLCDLPNQNDGRENAQNDVGLSEQFGVDFRRRVLAILEARGVKIGGYFAVERRRTAIVRFHVPVPNSAEVMADEIERVILQEGGVVALQDAVIGDVKVEADRTIDGAILVACGFDFGRRNEAREEHVAEHGTPEELGSHFLMNVRDRLREAGVTLDAPMRGEQPLTVHFCVAYEAKQKDEYATTKLLRAVASYGEPASSCVISHLVMRTLRLPDAYDIEFAGTVGRRMD